MAIFIIIPFDFFVTLDKTLILIIKNINLVDWEKHYGHYAGWLDS